MQTLSCGVHVGSSSPTTNRTRAPCIGSTESYPLGHQESPKEVSVLRALTSTHLQSPSYHVRSHIHKFGELDMDILGGFIILLTMGSINIC